jgi:anti-sigma-K factor RskA
MGHEEYKEMLSAHALAALDREAEHALNLHLSDCAACRKELDRLNETAAALALAADPVEPSPQVREQILKRIKTESQDVRPQESSTSAPETVGNSQVIPFRQPPRTVWRPIGSLGAIAATLVFAALLVSLILLWQQNRALKAALAKSTSQMQSAREELAQWRDLFTTPGAKMLELSGTGMAPGANAKLAYDKTGHAMLMARGLPAAPSGKAYQLWYIVGNKPMPGKVFKTDSSGNGMVQDQMPPVALQATTFAITMEPEGGTQAPTGAIYLHSGS